MMMGSDWRGFGCRCSCGRAGSLAPPRGMDVSAGLSAGAVDVSLGASADVAGVSLGFSGGVMDVSAGLSAGCGGVFGSVSGCVWWCGVRNGRCSDAKFLAVVEERLCAGGEENGGEEFCDGEIVLAVAVAAHAAFEAGAIGGEERAGCGRLGQMLSVESTAARMAAGLSGVTAPRRVSRSSCAIWGSGAL